MAHVTCFAVHGCGLVKRISFIIITLIASELLSIGTKWWKRVIDDMFMSVIAIIGRNFHRYDRRWRLNLTCGWFVFIFDAGMKTIWKYMSMIKTIMSNILYDSEFWIKLEIILWKNKRSTDTWERSTQAVILQRIRRHLWRQLLRW